MDNQQHKPRTWSKWSEEEDRLLIELYSNVSSISKAADRLGKTKNSVKSRVSVLGISRSKSPNWSEAEDKLLVELYGKVPISEIIDQLDRSNHSIHGRARALGLCQSIAPKWTEEEIAFLIKNSEIMSRKEIANALGRTDRDVKHKKHILGLKKDRSWTAEEDCFVRENYKTIIASQIAEKLSRTEHSIYDRAQKLGLAGPQFTIDETKTEFVLSNYGKLTPHQITEITGLTRVEVLYVAQKNGLERKFRGTRGSKGQKYLGALCPSGHDWNGTGKTLRNSTGACYECGKEYSLTHPAEVRASARNSYRKQRLTERYRLSQRLSSEKRRFAEIRAHACHIPLIFVEKRKEDFGKCCAYCKRSFSDLKSNKIHLDHFIPISQGGSHVESNLLVTCSTCNISKGAKDPYVWYSSQPFFSQRQWNKILKVLGKTHAHYNQIPLL